MNTYQKQLLLLLSQVLFGIPSDGLISDEILNEARLQSVSSLISKNEAFLIANNIRVNSAHAYLSKVLYGIPFVTIKGYSSAFYYPEPNKRPMGDVDIYVHPDDYNNALFAFNNNGFIPTGHSHDRHESFKKDMVVFELHSEIKGIPNGKDGINNAPILKEKKIRNCISNIIDTAIKIPTQYGEVIIPDEYHHAVIMLLHVAGHMINDGGIGLRHLCDWAVFVNKVDLEKYKSALEDLGLWTFSCQLTAVCIKYLGLREMSWVGSFEEDFLNQLIEDILSSGNFGRKDNYRAIMYDLSDNNQKLSVFELIKKRFPVVQHYPILFPGAFIFWGLRYLIRCLVGKRHLISKYDIEQGKKRKELYKQFKLFE